MDTYNDFFLKYCLVDKPEIHPFISELIVLTSVELQGKKPHYAIADKRSDRVRILLRSGTYEFPEYVEMVIPFSLGSSRDVDLSSNLWTETHQWVHNDCHMEYPLTIMFLNADYLDGGQTDRKIDSFVRFYDPFVVAVVESYLDLQLHQDLFRNYTGKYKLKLEGYSENTIWLYHDEDKVCVQGNSNNNIHVVDILRRRGGSAFSRHLLNAQSLMEQGESSGAH